MVRLHRENCQCELAGFWTTQCDAILELYQHVQIFTHIQWESHWLSWLSWLSMTVLCVHTAHFKIRTANHENCFVWRIDFCLPWNCCSMSSLRSRNYDFWILLNLWWRFGASRLNGNQDTTEINWTQSVRNVSQSPWTNEENTIIRNIWIYCWFLKWHLKTKYYEWYFQYNLSWCWHLYGSVRFQSFTTSSNLRSCSLTMNMGFGKVVFVPFNTILNASSLNRYG